MGLFYVVFVTEMSNNRKEIQKHVLRRTMPKNAERDRCEENTVFVCKS